MEPKEPDSRLKLIQKDFEDKDLYKVNQVVNDLYSKIDSTRINGKFYERSQFEDIWLNTDRDPNTLADKEVLNLGEIRKLGTISGSATTTVISGGGGGGGSNCYFEYYDLTAATTDIISPVSSATRGDRLTVRLKQDATGGRQITWNVGPPEFILVTVNDVDVRPNRVTMLDFVFAEDGNWWLCSVLGGRIP